MSYRGVAASQDARFAKSVLFCVLAERMRAPACRRRRQSHGYHCTFR